MQFYLLFCFLLNLLVVLNFDKVSKFVNLYDYPSVNIKKHRKKISNIGGLLIFINIILFTIYFSTNSNFLELNFFFIFFLQIVFFIGYLDDKYNLSYNIKFFLLSCILLTLVFLNKDDLLIESLQFSFLTKSFDLGNFSIFFTVLSFLLFINAFNMFDGINLQSGIYSIFVFVIFFFKGVNKELSSVIIVSSFFFVYLNYKNKCFLGNGGSILLPFVIAYFFAQDNNSNQFFYADEIFLIMLIPGIDMLRLFVTRILRGNNPFKGDREHIHHLLSKRFTKFKTVLIILGLVFISNLAGAIYGSFTYVIVISLFVYFFIIYLLTKKI
jgi:UDP-GlcNAc:undecaprenyl-phosphate GlcNAc-1-phosphate transferase